ncbi:MFS transporter [Salirhabdus salicampi]|uniref:MFS transporter n=1 Tax=Salirhabdus salicampi TaxID=476102 RepID=UPI0020C3418A|nr:MFS transporter [Salirhabdus salicampi]MCP8617913.1 MFS transporter [Salirhabdus salicampi]
MQPVSAKTRFFILVSLVGISGFSQGMLLPLIAVILEQANVSSTINGLHATGLYIGVLLASPFMERPLQKFGFKPVILTGGALVFTSLFFFTLWESLWFWFMLRMAIGIGDHILHFATQTWITTTSHENNRGRDIAFYGMSFGIGFTLGPLMTRFLSIHPGLPFIISALLSMAVWSLMFLLRNEFPEQDQELDTTTKGSFIRFWEALKIAWVAFLLPLTYGFLEATLHGNFPVYGMRIGHSVDMLSIIIPCFAAGSLISQIPLGTLSDKVGRKPILLYVLFLGAISFLFASIFETSAFSLIILFTLSGMFVGSLFSLGISYMADLLPKRLLPAGNILCGISFSVGSITGPLLGGLFIEFFPMFSFFHIITVTLIIVFTAVLIKKPTKKPLAERG